MSTLFVDTVNQKTIGNGVQIPGHVVQTVVYGVGQGSPAFSNSTTVTIGSGQTVIIGSGTITPTSSSNKILVCGHNVCHQSNASGYVYLRIMRDSSIVQTPGNAVGYTFPVGARINVPYFFLDSPATTSAITYSHRVDYLGGTLNQIWNYGSVSLVLMEIAQ